MSRNPSRLGAATKAASLSCSLTNARTWSADIAPPGMERLTTASEALAWTARQSSGANGRRTNRGVSTVPTTGDATLENITASSARGMEDDVSGITKTGS
jgi:hypothetical protein